MPKVTLTGNAYAGNGRVIPAANRPELWFQPIEDKQSASVLVTGVESKATLNTSTGAFTVEVFSAPGLMYLPYITWVVNPVDAEEKWSRRRAYWEPLLPGSGGAIGALMPLAKFNGVVTGFGPPGPEYVDVFYADVSGVVPVFYGPEE